jgi:hypothetical protein
VQATLRLRATHPLTAELPKPPAAWSESFAALAIALGLPVRDLEQAHAYLSTFWRSHGRGRSRNQAEKGDNETCPAGLSASQDNDRQGVYPDCRDALAFSAGLPPVKCPSLYPDCSRRSTLCEMCQSLPCLFSQICPLFDVPVSTLFVLAVFPPVRCPSLLPVCFRSLALCEMSRAPTWQPSQVLPRHGPQEARTGLAGRFTS